MGGDNRASKSWRRQHIKQEWEETTDQARVGGDNRAIKSVKRQQIKQEWEETTEQARVGGDNRASKSGRRQHIKQEWEETTEQASRFVDVRCLLDTGAQVSTITESFFREHLIQEGHVQDVSRFRMEGIYDRLKHQFL